MNEDEARERMPHIWNHPDLLTMTAEEHEALALELREIARQHGIGGEAVFREMCETIRKQRGKP